MKPDNPVYDLLVESLDCADRLPVCPSTVMTEALHRAAAVVELPDWVPQFVALVQAMALPEDQAWDHSNQKSTGEEGMPFDHLDEWTA